MATAMRKEYLKAKKVAHPNSRKSLAIAKRAKNPRSFITKEQFHLLREMERKSSINVAYTISNRQKAKVTGLIKQNLVAEKMLWIQEHMAPDVCPYTPELTARLLETYIARNDEEMEQIAIKKSIRNNRSRQHASREDVLRMTKEREQEEYDTCGIEIPDILNATQCEMLRNWNSELRYMTNFKFRRFGRKHLNEALQRINKISKEMQSEISEKSGDSAEISPESTDVTPNKSTDSKDNRTECSMEIE